MTGVTPLWLVRSVSPTLRSAGTPSLAIHPPSCGSRPGGVGGSDEKVRTFARKSAREPPFQPPLGWSSSELGPVRLGSSPIRLGSSHSPLGRGPRRAPRGAPRGGPPGGARGAPRGGPRPGAPRGPPGPPGAGPSGTPKKGRFWALSTMVIYGNGGSWGAPLGPPGGPPGTPPCTFFWVFNNSPSRDSFGPPAGPPRDPPGAPGPGQDTQSLAIGWGSGGGNTPQ